MIAAVPFVSASPPGPLDRARPRWGASGVARAAAAVLALGVAALGWGCAAAQPAGGFGPGENDPGFSHEHWAEAAAAYDIAGGRWIDVDAPAGDVTLTRSPDGQARVRARVNGFGPDDLSARRLAHTVKVRDWFDEAGVLRLAADLPAGETVEEIVVDARGRVYVNHARVPRADFHVAVPRDVNVRVRRCLALSARGVIGNVEAHCQHDAAVRGHEGDLRLTCDLGGVMVERAAGDITAEGCGRVEVRDSSGAKVLRCSPGAVTVLGGDGKVEVDAGGDVQVVSHLPRAEAHHIISERGGVRLSVSPESSLAIHAFSANGAVVFGDNLLPLAKVVSRTAGADGGDDRPMNSVDAFLGAGEAPVDIRARGEVRVDLYRN
ncbi:MAG: hypothetical protein HY719_02305 [Planctomycetes bacterium]|nr:hypothetical protein [Planctomycetota bacterium]